MFCIFRNKKQLSYDTLEFPNLLHQSTSPHRPDVALCSVAMQSSNPLFSAIHPLVEHSVEQLLKIPLARQSCSSV